MRTLTEILISVAVACALGTYLVGCGRLQHDINVAGGITLTHTVSYDELYSFYLHLCNGNVGCANERLTELHNWIISTGGSDE